MTARTMALMAKEPRLLRRPILDTGREVIVGFDRTRYAAVLGTGTSAFVQDRKR